MYHVNSLVIKPSMAPSKEPYNFMFHKWPSVISNQDLRVQVNKIAHSQQIKSRPQLNGKQGLVWFGLVKQPRRNLYRLMGWQGQNVISTHHLSRPTHPLHVYLHEQLGYPLHKT